MLYVFIDPFNELTSGVSTYVKTASQNLRSVAFNSTIVIAKNSQENLNAFRIRVASEISLLPKDGLIVEAPETLYATKYLPLSTTIHIRLHGSRQLGRKLQGFVVDGSEIEAEKKEIRRAAYISAPSSVAEISSRILYGGNLAANLYPNPCPQFEANTESIEKLFDVIFLGRWQEMKGADYVKRIKKFLPNLKIAIACTKKPWDLPRGIPWIPVNSVKDRSLAISSSQIVLIPSLFETASMVGLEALAAGCPIVTWSHLGICEYADNELIFSAAPGDTTDLIKKINQAITSSVKLDKKKIQDSVNFINLSFINGFNKSLKVAEHCNTMPFPRKEIQLESSLLKMIGEKSKNERKIIYMRKLRKLVNNPWKFFIDSRVLSWLFKKSSHGQLNIKASENAISASKVESSLGTIPRKGSIKIKSPPSKPHGWVSVLVYKFDDRERAEELYEKLISMSDFAPFLSRNFTQICIDICPNEEVMSILERIDINGKTKLGAVSNFIFIDTPLNIIEAVRSVGPYVKTIMIRTAYSESNSIRSAHYIDALISSVPDDLEIPGLRRANYFSSIDSLSQMLRKVVQETGPKSPDMLIPLIGCLNYSKEYLNFDSRRYQGIIYIKRCVNERSDDFLDYLNKFSKNIIGMLIVESIYMRYRSVCESIEMGGNPAELLQLSLFDGAIFDVREVN